MKTKKKKLSLKKLTIANLHNEEMKRIYGGMESGELCCTDNCYTSDVGETHNSIDFTCRDLY